MISILLLLATSLEAINSKGLYGSTYQFCNKLAVINGSCIDQSMLCKAYKPNKEKTGNDSKIVPMNQRLMDSIVEQHNSIRNKFACGNASNINDNFPEAANMGLLGWNNELSLSASQLAETCINSKVCPASEHYLTAGQNIYMHKTEDDNVDVGEMIEKIIGKWKYSTGDLDRFSETTEMHVDFGQIAQIINDKASLVGCALYDCGMERDLHNYFFVCNYDVASFVKDELYATGKSKCLKNDKHKCLCDKPKSTGKSQASPRFVKDVLILLCILGVSGR